MWHFVPGIIGLQGRLNSRDPLKLMIAMYRHPGTTASKRGNKPPPGIPPRLKSVKFFRENLGVFDGKQNQKPLKMGEFNGFWGLSTGISTCRHRTDLLHKVQNRDLFGPYVPELKRSTQFGPNHLIFNIFNHSLS